MGIDAVAPVAQPTGVAYDVAANTITITAATTDLGFTGITSDTTQDIQSYLDWTKFKWILNEQDAGGTTVNFNGDGATTAATDYVTSAKITSDTTMVITLGSAGVTALEGNAGFGNLGGTAFGEGTDAVKIFEGFVKDAAGNSADLDGSGDIDATNDYVLFSDVNAKVSGGSGNTAVTYTNAGNAPTITSFALTNNGGDNKSTYIAGDTVLITATADMNVTKGSTFTAVLDVTGTGSVGVTDPTLTFTAAADGTTLTATHTIASGENIAAAIITSANYGLGATTLDSQYTGGGLTSTFPTNSNISGVGIDAVASSVVVTDVDYNPSTNKLILNGSGFDSINAATASTDVKAFLGQNSKKIVWDVDKDSSGVDIEIAIGDITNTVTANDGQLTITLSDAKAAAIEGSANYALSTVDQVTIQTGFFSDVNSNIGSETAVTDTVDFLDTTAPVITGVTTTTVAGKYKQGDAAIPIVVTFDEALKSDSTMNVKLSTGDVITLAYASPTTMSGNYTIGSLEADVLKIKSGTDGIVDATIAVEDLYGNAVNSTYEVPNSANLENTTIIKISNLLEADIVSGAENDEADANDVVLFRFEGTVTNKTAIETVLDNAGFDGTYSWNARDGAADAQLNVTLGASETLSVDSDGEISVADVDVTIGGVTTQITYTFDFIA